VVALYAYKRGGKVLKKVIDIILSFSKENPVMIFFVLYIIFALLFVPGFSSPVNLRNIIIQSTDLVIIACGLVFVVMNGGIDFSITSNIAIGSVIGAMIMSTSEGWLMGSIWATPAAIAAMLLCGLLIGCINAFSVTILKMPSFIATMVTQLVIGGLALWIPLSRTIPNLPESFTFLHRGELFPGLRMPVAIAILVVIVGSYMLHKSLFGRHLFAIGTNHKTSRISGVSVNKVIFKTFLICGFLAALGGIITTARIGAGVPDLGRTIFLDVLAAIIIGGTSITGGKGSIPGAAMGAVFVIVLMNSLSFMGVTWFAQNVFLGFLVLAAAVLDIIKQQNFSWGANWLKRMPFRSENT